MYLTTSDDVSNRDIILELKLKKVSSRPAIVRIGQTTKLPPGIAKGIRPPSTTHHPNANAMSRACSLARAREGAMLARASVEEKMYAVIARAVDAGLRPPPLVKLKNLAGIHRAMSELAYKNYLRRYLREWREPNRTIPRNKSDRTWLLSEAVDLVSDDALTRSKSVSAPRNKPDIFLSADFEYVLAKRYRQGDRAAGDKIIVAHQPLVRNAASKWRATCAKKGASLNLDDLVQEANVAVLVCLKTFDPDNPKKARFGTYALTAIRWRFRKYTEDERSHIAGVSLNAPANNGGTVERQDLLVDDADNEVEYPRKRQLDALTAALKTLSPRELSVFEARRLSEPSYQGDPQFYDGRGPTPERLAKVAESFRYRGAKYSLREEKPTLVALGRKHGISAERARQIGNRAFSKIKAQLGVAI